MKALVFGASGETGREVVIALEKRKEFSKVFVVSRKSLGYSFDKMEEIIIKEFSEISAENVPRADVAFCCIGTSFGKVTRKEFIEIERNLIYKLATFTFQNGCRNFHMISGFASNPNSKFFIPMVKGECEQLLSNIGFPRLTIYRPGLLRCIRSEFRPLEALAIWFSYSFDWFDLWSVDTITVARAMVNEAIMESTQDKLDPIAIFEHGEIVKRGHVMMEN